MDLEEDFPAEAGLLEDGNLSKGNALNFYDFELLNFYDFDLRRTHE